MAGGSRIVISDEGITISTGRKIVYQAGQHKFEGGRQVKAEMPQLPSIKSLEEYSHRLDLSNLYDDKYFSNVKYFAFKEGDNSSYVSGTLDQWGRTERFISENPDEYILMICDPDDSWEVMINPDTEEKEE